MDSVRSFSQRTLFFAIHSRISPELQEFEVDDTSFLLLNKNETAFYRKMSLVPFSTLRPRTSGSEQVTFPPIFLSGISPPPEYYLSFR